MDLLVCKMIEEISTEVAAQTKSIQRRCSDCGTLVWLVPKNLLLQALVVCGICATKRIAIEFANGEEIEFVDASTIKGKVGFDS